MTIRQPIDTAEFCRSYAHAVYELLRVDKVADLSYDGDTAVTAGPVVVQFTTTAVKVWFTDPYADPDNGDDIVVLAIGGQYSLGAIVTVAQALAAHLAVTR